MQFLALPQMLFRFQSRFVVNHREDMRYVRRFDEIRLVESVEAADVEITGAGDAIDPAHGGVGGAAVEEVGHRLVGGNHIGLEVGM